VTFEFTVISINVGRAYPEMKLNFTKLCFTGIDNVTLLFRYFGQSDAKNPGLPKKI
jgi:hypothetical protein